MAESVNSTVSTYDRIAEAYWQTNHRRAAEIHADLDRFADQLSPSSTVIDVGCGPAFDTVELRQRGLNAFGFDLSRGMLLQSQGHYDVPLFQANMCHLPLANGVDGLWVMASMLHLPKDLANQAMAEFVRVLRPGGVMHISVKSGRNEFWDNVSYGQSRYFQFWESAEFDTLLNNHGFTIIHKHKTSHQRPFLVRLARLETP